MRYPIFNSVVNKIEEELTKREIKVKNLKTWNDDRINATGLEILIDMRSGSRFIKEFSINFDWDRFRETVLAGQLEGMDEHPMLLQENKVKTSISPIIDIEISWIFDEEKSQPEPTSDNGNYRLETASQWMEQISRDVNELLADDDIITRWHIEVEGDDFGKYLAAINLISYFQYTLDGLKSLNEVHDFVSQRLQELLLKSRKVVNISDQNLESVAA